MLSIPVKHGLQRQASTSKALIVEMVIVCAAQCLQPLWTREIFDYRYCIAILDHQGRCFDVVILVSTHKNDHQITLIVGIIVAQNVCPPLLWGTRELYGHRLCHCCDLFHKYYEPRTICKFVSWDFKENVITCVMFSNQNLGENLRLFVCVWVGKGR